MRSGAARRRLLLLLLGCLVSLAPVPPARAQPAGELGIVLMHGKQGSPERGIDKLAGRLGRAGYLIDRPILCWSRARIYDRAFLDCIGEVESAFARLKARGARRIVVAGQSLGGAAALAVGARRDGLAGIVALAPAPSPDLGRRSEIARDLERARRMVQAGRGEERARFTDSNEGLFQVDTTARIYLSFLAPDGPANIVQNSAAARAPLLWVAGDQDQTQQGRDFAFAKAPPHPLSRYATVRATHLGTPDAAVEVVLAWLRELAAAATP